VYHALLLVSAAADSICLEPTSSHSSSFADITDRQIPLNAPSTLGTGSAEERFDDRDKYYIPQRFVNRDAENGIDFRKQSTWSPYVSSWLYDQAPWRTCVANTTETYFIFG